MGAKAQDLTCLRGAHYRPFHCSVKIEDEDNSHSIIICKVRYNIAAPVTASAPSKDSVYVVPAGYYVLACPAFSQADPRIWKNASEFDATRWSDLEGVIVEVYKK